MTYTRPALGDPGNSGPTSAVTIIDALSDGLESVELRATSIYDSFSAKSNGTPTRTDSGHVYVSSKYVSGGTLADAALSVVSGELTHAGSGWSGYLAAGYLEVNAQAPIKRIGASVKWTVAGTGQVFSFGSWKEPIQKNLTSSNPIVSGCHIRLTPTTWAYDVWTAGSLATVASGSYAALTLNQAYTVSVEIVGDTAVLYTPDGGRQVITDSRIATNAGHIAYWENYTNAGTSAGCRTLSLWAEPQNPARHYGVFDVRDFGAVGDGIVNDTTAINNAITALNAAGRGVLHFPPGTYLVSSALTAITVKATIRGEGSDGMWMDGGVSTINCTSGTANLLTLSQHGCTVRDLSIRNTAGSTPTAGAGIRVTKGDALRLVDVAIRGFYDNVHMADGMEWYISRCMFYGMVRYGIYLGHDDLGDGGDGSISDSFFISDKYDAPTGIYHFSGGGLKITSCKFNGRPDAGTYGDYSYPGPFTRMNYGYYGAINQSTSILIIGDCSFENYKISAVHVQPTGSVQYPYILINNSQFAPHYAATSGVTINGATGVVDMANVANSTFHGPGSGTAIALTSIGVSARVTSCHFRSWTTNVSTSSVTGYVLV